MKNFIKEYTYEVNHSAHDWSNTMSTLISSRQNLQQMCNETRRRCDRIAGVRRIAVEEARLHYKRYLERRGVDYASMIKDRYGVTIHERLDDLGRVRRSILRKAKELVVQREMLSANSRSLVAVEEKLRKCKRSSLSLYRSPAEPRHVDAVELTRQIKALSFIHSAFFTIKEDTKCLVGRVRFLPFPVQRYNPDEDENVGAPIIAYPFALKVRIPADPKYVDVKEVFRPVQPQRLPYSRSFPHEGCLGGAEPHLAMAVKHKDVVNALCIYYSYICTANVLDPYGAGADHIELHQQDVPSIENLSLHHYRRYHYAESSEPAQPF